MSESLRFKLQVNCDNAAFDDAIASELARILRDVARKLEDGIDCEHHRNINDGNGNVVGTFVLRTEPL